MRPNDSCDKHCSLAVVDQLAPATTRRRGYGVGRSVAVATAATAGALAIVLTCSATAAVTSLGQHHVPSQLEVRLTTAGTDVQAAIDQLVQARDGIIATNSAYPWASDFDKTILPNYTQSGFSSFLLTMLSNLELKNAWNQEGLTGPYPSDAPDAEAQLAAKASFPYNAYNFPAVESSATEPNATQVVTYYPSPATAPGSNAFAIGAETGLNQHTTYPLDHFTPNADGTYTITVSPTEQPGNWVDSAGGTSVVLRTTPLDWGVLHGSTSVAYAPGPTTIIPQPLSDSEIASFLTTFAHTIPYVNASPQIAGLQEFIATDEPTNMLSDTGQLPPAYQTAESSEVFSWGHFSLTPDQALIIKVPDVDAGNVSVSMMDAWIDQLPFVTKTGSVINGSDTGNDLYYVVSAKDPGVANWVNDNGDPNGDILIRFRDLPDGVQAASGAQVTAEVVNINDVRSALPSDFPTVTAAERAADLHNQMFDHNYFLDQNRGVGWVTTMLLEDQLKNAMGSSEYNDLFGSQSDVPSVLDRLLNPNLIPDLGAAFHEVLTDPSGSLTATVANLPVLAKDVELPMLLALGLTYDAIETGAGPQNMTTLLGEIFTDPASSITAGFLNVRDDLLISLAHAGSYPALTSTDVSIVWDQLTALHQSASQALSEVANGLLHGAAAAAAGVDLLP